MDMNEIMRKVQDFQRNMGRIQEDLSHRQVSSSAGGGMVSVTVNGNQEMISIAIEKEVIDPDDPVMLQDLIVAAVNEAMKNARNMAQAEMTKLTGGIKVPGLF